jgi:hypothetical protein
MSKGNMGGGDFFFRGHPPTPHYRRASALRNRKKYHGRTTARRPWYFFSTKTICCTTTTTGTTGSAMGVPRGAMAVPVVLFFNETNQLSALPMKSTTAWPVVPVVLFLPRRTTENHAWLFFSTKPISCQCYPQKVPRHGTVVLFPDSNQPNT